MLLDQFLAFIRQELFAAPEGPWLLSVSGGLDSMVLAHLCKQAGIPFGMAHCNYQLRGEDSKADARLVQEMAQEWGVPHFQVDFDTRAIGKREKKSIQVVARELRYAWLEALRREKGYSLIATAHHANDQFETVLLNLTNGCGIRGLHGIFPKREALVRPLLFATRKMLEDYALLHKVPFRQDASNAADHYDRNKIRLHVVPVLKSINPSLEAGFLKTLKRLREAESLYQWAVDQLMQTLLEPTPYGYKMSIERLAQLPAPETLLYEWLNPFGYNNDQTESIWAARGQEPGKRFFSPTHRLLVDRQHLWLEPLPDEQPLNYLIPEPPFALDLPDGKLTFEYQSGVPGTFPSDTYTAYLDYDKLSFPLVLRHWNAGDVFQPLGMNGRHKKVQDLFSDEKINRFEKERIWILTSAGQICWIIGLRADERFKIFRTSPRLLKATFIKKA